MTTKIECETCKEEIINPKFILTESTSAGYMDLEFCSVKCFIKYLLKKFGRKLLKIEKENIKCFICGKKAGIHSLSGNHHPPYVPLCKKHHLDIENIKLAIKIMNKEKKVSLRRFRQVIDSFEVSK